MGSPLATSADKNADAPGTGTIRMWCRTASATSRYPGSLTPGMPASLTMATLSPFSRCMISSAARVNSLCSW